MAGKRVAKRISQPELWPYSNNEEHPSDTKYCRGVVSAANGAHDRTTEFVHEAGEFPLTAFYANEYNSDGLSSACVLCDSAVRKLRARVRAASPNAEHWCNGAHGYGGHVVTAEDMPPTSSTSLCRLHSNAASKGLIVSPALWAALWNSGYGLCHYCAKPLKLNSARMYSEGEPPTLPHGLTCGCARFRAAERKIPPLAAAILIKHEETLAALAELGISPRRALEMLGVEMEEGS